MAKKDVTVEEKLKALYDLQVIDSTIDRIRTTRGELPLEVQDLEDEVAGLETRLENMTNEISDLTTSVSNKKNSIKDSKALIKKYEEQQKKVRNNREFDAITKEMEFQTLEMELAEKRIKEYDFGVREKEEKVTESKEYLDGRKIDLDTKKKELKEITDENQKDEDDLTKKSAKASKIIEERLIAAYNRIRGNARNGLAVVTVQRDSCGGCFNKVPPQRQLDIKSHKKIIVCEHCGRILVDANFDPNYVEPVEEVKKPKRKATTKKKKVEA